MKFLKDLVWITQLGLSVAMPIAIFVLGALWLRNRYHLGAWILVLGIVLGLYSGFSAFRSFAKIMEQTHKDKDKKDKTPPVSFREHD